MQPFHKNPPIPHVSVVVPALNEEKYIDHLLESLTRQTYKNFEIIVFDNNSIDKTEEVAKKFGAKVYKGHTKGVGQARQEGCKHAKGDIIACTDSDAILPVDWVERITKAFEKNPAMVAYGGIPQLYSGPMSAKLAAKYLFYPFSVIDKFFSGGWNLSGFSLAVRRDAFEKVGGFNPDLVMGEDIDLCEKLRKIGDVVLDKHFIIDVSGRRYRHGLFVTLFTTYAPNLFMRLLFKKPTTYEFKPIREKTPEVIKK